MPDSIEQLRTLAGVGRKTANVVYAVAFGGQAIAVDTHVFRVSNRLGIADAKNVLDTEKTAYAGNSAAYVGGQSSLSAAARALRLQGAATAV